MPDQKLCISDPRTVELQVFDDFAIRDLDAKEGCDDLGSASSSLQGECREFNRVSTALAAKLAGSATGVSVSKPKVRTRFPKIAPGLRKASSLKTVGSEPSRVQAARAVVRSHVETTGEAQLEWKKKTAKALFQSPPSKEDVKLEIVETHGPSINPSEFRGVRVRPGVRGFLVEIRPRRWKKTIWLGTFKTGPEAARAYDAGVFYTGKDGPFNFQESKDSFPPLPEHLSLDDSDPRLVDQLITFVKIKAQEAAGRGKVEPKKGSSEVPQNGKKKLDHNAVSSSSVGVQRCTVSAGLRSDQKGSLHVKDEDYASSDLLNSNPFENLEPLPDNQLPHYSNTKQDLNLGDDHMDCWGWISHGVHDYLPQAGILEAEDIYFTKQTSYLTVEDVFPDQTRSYQSVLGSKNDGDLGNPTISQLDSWGRPSFDPAVRDLACQGSEYGLPENFLNLEAWPEARKLHDWSFAMTQFNPEDVSVLCQSVEDGSLVSGCVDSFEEPDDDEAFSVSLWQCSCNRG